MANVDVAGALKIAEGRFRPGRRDARAFRDTRDLSTP
jgi:hypothetical protein